jgi:hypothetical protein
MIVTDFYSHSSPIAGHHGIMAKHNPATYAQADIPKAALPWH